MVPDIDLQLQIAIKSLADMVVPAVDPADKVATEQLQLVIATLTMVRERVPVERRMVRRLLDDDIALAGRIIDAGAGDADLEAAAAAARDALADPELDAVDLDRVRQSLTSRTASLIATAGADGVDILARAVIGGSKAPLERLRAWCLPSGFEPYPAQIPPLDTVL